MEKELSIGIRNLIGIWLKLRIMVSEEQSMPRLREKLNRNSDSCTAIRMMGYSLSRLGCP